MRTDKQTQQAVETHQLIRGKALNLTLSTTSNYVLYICTSLQLGIVNCLPSVFSVKRTYMICSISVPVLDKQQI